MSQQPPFSTASGIPVADNQNSLSAGPRGPLLLQDFHLIEKLQHFNRERIPERVVHAKGSGAYGTFTVTHDIARYTKAKLFSEVGKQTATFARFSTVGGERGSADTERDPRGFAVRFYTEEGNWDLVGNNTPMFFIKDPIKFPDFVHTQKRDPQSNLKSAEMMFDFWSHAPESLHQVTMLFSDRGAPDGYRHMDGFGSQRAMICGKPVAWRSAGTDANVIVTGHCAPFSSCPTNIYAAARATWAPVPAPGSGADHGAACKPVPISTSIRPCQAGWNSTSSMRRPPRSNCRNCGPCSLASRASPISSALPSRSPKASSPASAASPPSRRTASCKAGSQANRLMFSNGVAWLNTSCVFSCG